MEIYEKISALAEDMTAELIATRRDFHKYAESGWTEMRTSSLIARRLTDLGYEVLTGEAVCDRDARMGVPEQAVLDKAYERAIAQGGDPEFLPATRDGMTGVIGILRCGEGPTMALRFDIDALGVMESEDADHIPAREGFASVNPGVMHACGHDGHATTGLGVAKVLMEIKDRLHGTVKLIFQPAEEGVRGAKSIVTKGHLDKVDYFLGTHITGSKNGQVYLIPGSYGSLATCKYDAYFTGKSAHAGASPHTGHSAMQAAAAAVLHLYAIPRHGGGASRINVGTLTAGTGRNVIADRAKLELEVRGANTEINNYMCENAERVLTSCAQMYGCQVTWKLAGAADSMVSDVDYAERLAEYAKAAGLAVGATTIPSFGSEDVSYMVNRVQEQGGKASFARLMTKAYAPAHNVKYNFDEAVLPFGVKAVSTAVYSLLK
ncbi:MAG: amidohydrolase [Oscillospiraceae bacterium]|nr:amidohydrolase [Oscillospiraceae bacterium]